MAVVSDYMERSRIRKITRKKDTPEKPPVTKENEVIVGYIVKADAADKAGIRIARGGDAPILKSPSGSFDW